MTEFSAGIRRLLNGYAKEGDRLLESHELSLDYTTIVSIVGDQSADPGLLGA